MKEEIIKIGSIYKLKLTGKKVMVLSILPNWDFKKAQRIEDSYWCRTEDNLKIEIERFELLIQ